MFRDNFFIALNRWQRGWAENQEQRLELSALLKDECAFIDEKYKTNDQPCYRKRFIHKGELVDILINDYKAEGVTSWTTDIRYAEFFKGKYRESAVTAAIFEHIPENNEIILNINELWKCDSFIMDLEKFSIKNPFDCEAIYNFKDFQKEILLEAPLKGSEICILSGISSPFDDLCSSMDIPEVNRPHLFQKLIRDGAFIEEVTYVKDENARNAVRNTVKLFFEMIENLQTIK